MTAVIIVVLVLVLIALWHYAKKHPAFAKWAKRGVIAIIILFLVGGAAHGNGIALGLIEIAIGVALIALISSFFH